MSSWVVGVVAFLIPITAACLIGTIIGLLFDFALRLFSRRKQANMQEAMSEDRQARLEFLQTTRKTIEDYRERFRTSPCGQWSQLVGTFGGVMDEMWKFNPDHTGKIIETGPFGGGGETLFEWKEVADFAIACKVTKWSFEDFDDDFPDDDDDEQETAQAENGQVQLEQWDIIRYDFKVIPTDSGELIGMYQVSEDGTLCNGFWHSVTPLTSSEEW